jgi:hypothetical protein
VTASYGTFGRLVPRDPLANVRWRRTMLTWAGKAPSRHRMLVRMSAEDPLFWLNAWGWTYDPRRHPNVLPFATYPYQDRGVITVNEAIERRRDLTVPKARDMGASWLVLSVFMWRWLFRSHQTFLCVSRNMDYVDRTGDPKSLFWKLDMLASMMPVWMMPRKWSEDFRTMARLENPDNGSVVVGEATTGDIGRGGRSTAILLDEFAAVEPDRQWATLASTRDNTKTRIFVSTPSGEPDGFSQMCDKKSDAVWRLDMRWQDHPLKAEGLYVRDGRDRSPWYDAECSRCATQREIDTEIDMMFRAGRGSFFDDGKVSAIRARCRVPAHVGELRSEGREISLERYPAGRLRVWCHVGADGCPPRDRAYAVGIDVATGTGASNSVMSVFDRRTGEQCAEWAHSECRPDQLAREADVLCRWFRDDRGYPATAVWEHIGPGRTFGDILVNDLGHRMVWRRHQDAVVGPGKEARHGFFPNKETKVDLYQKFRKMLYEGSCTPYSADAVDELREIGWDADGGLSHGRSRTIADPSGAKANHGDRATAVALACLVLAESPTVGAFRPDAEIPRVAMPGSLKWRQEQRKADREAASSAAWDRRW